MPSLRFQTVRKMRALLVREFPEAFRPRGSQRPKLPLKTDIHVDVLAALAGKAPVEHLMWAVRDYVTGKSYLAACVAGAQRVDLAGRPAGVVRPEHAAWAASQLARKLAAGPRAARARKPHRRPPVVERNGRRGDSHAAH